MEKINQLDYVILLTKQDAILAGWTKAEMEEANKRRLELLDKE